MKDVVTVYLVHRTYTKHYHNGRIPEDKVGLMKFLISLIAFTLEDCGQAIIQFYYYERYMTQVTTLTIVNAYFMAFFSLKSFIELANYSVDDESGNYM